MDWSFIQAIVVLVAIVGWWVIHDLTSRRDVENERRKIKISYLIEAYRTLESAAYATENKDAELQSSVADIQLLGSPSQVKLASELAIEMGENNKASVHKLLSDLRDSLRKELQLGSVDQEVMYLRFSSKT